MTTLAVGSALCGIGGYRLARVVTADSVSAPAREWIYDRAYETDFTDGGRAVADQQPTATRNAAWAWLYRLVSCAFCSGFWLTLALAAAWFQRFSARTVIAALAAVGVQAFLSARETP